MEEINWEEVGLLHGLDKEYHDQLSNALNFIYDKVKDLDDSELLKRLIFPFVRRIFGRIENKEDFDIEDIYQFCLNHLNNETYARNMGDIRYYSNIDAEAEYVAFITDKYIESNEN